jgi:hypothetical protein
MFKRHRISPQLCIVSVLLILAASVSYAQSSDPPQQMRDWLTLTAHQGSSIPPGTRITLQNWRQYQQYMPMGMNELFKGTYYWKIPQDVEIDVGPRVSYPPPSFYIAATEKYGGQVRVVHMLNGHNDIANYVAGEPFPSPQEPDKGYKLLVDLWFAYYPYLGVGGSGNPLNSCTMDRFNSINCLVVEYVYRQLAYNADPSVPRNDPRAGDMCSPNGLRSTCRNNRNIQLSSATFPKTISATRSYTFFCHRCGAR